MIGFGSGINTGRPANGSCKPRIDQALIQEQWKTYNAERELAQAEMKIKKLQWLVGDLSMLVEVLRDNGVLVDMMSDADQMVVKHLIELLQ